MAEAHVTDRLRALRDRAGLSMREMARMLGYAGASSYQRYEDKAIVAGYEEFLPFNFVRKLAAVLVGKGKPPIELSEVMMLAGVAVDKSGTLLGAHPDIHADLGWSVDNPDRSRGPGIDNMFDEISENSREYRYQPTRAILPRDVPVFGVRPAEELGQFKLTNQTVDQVRRPPGLAAARNVFAIYMPDQSMYPWRSIGDPVYLNSGRPPKDGDFVLVTLNTNTDNEFPNFLIRRLVSIDLTDICLAQFNPLKEDIRITREAVRSIIRVVDWPELLGV